MTIGNRNIAAFITGLLLLTAGAEECHAQWWKGKKDGKEERFQWRR
ncbi:MAG: hypothetical protein IJ307_04685 [Bacteroidales bacterium]|nr:hypothetical protein [Bacteroidales bacterium]MBQ8855898.1 hypothetical protein [Bacteroidales bacterium]